MMWVWIVLAIVLVALLIAFTTRMRDAQTQPAQRLDPHDSAMEILEERFAEGEIDHKEFERKKRALRG